MADENSTLVGGTQTSAQTGDDFVIGFGNDDASGSTNPTVTDSGISEDESNSSQNQEVTTSDESKEESQKSSDSDVQNDDFSDFDVFGSSDADFTETEQDVNENIPTESENDVVNTENTESSEEALPAEGSESTDNVMQENSNSESQVSAPVEEKKFVPLDENLGQDLNVDFDMGEDPKVGEDSAKSEDYTQTSDGTMTENLEVEKNSENVLDDSDLFSTEEKEEENSDDLNILVENTSLDSSESEVVIEETTEPSVMDNAVVELENQIIDKSISEDNFVFTDSNNEPEENQTVENKTTNLNDNLGAEDSIVEPENSTLFNENSIDMEGANAVESENFQTEPENTDLIQNKEEKTENSSDFNFTTDENQDSTISDSLMTEEISEPSMQEVVNDNATQIEEIVPEVETVNVEQLNIENPIEEPGVSNQAESFQQEEILENNENSQIDSQLDMESEGNVAFTPVEDEKTEDMENSTTDEVVSEQENPIFQPVETETQTLEVSSNVNPQESEQGILDNEVISFNQTDDSVAVNTEIETKSDDFGSIDFSFDLPSDTDSNTEQEKISETTQSENEFPADKINIELMAAQDIENVSDSKEAEEMPDIVDNQFVNIETQTPVEEVKTSVEENQAPDEQVQTVESTQENANSEVQTTLSLDQIMDAELLSSNQILTQPAPSNVAVIPEKKNNKKLIAAVMSVGLILVLGFVTVTAFPNLLSNNDFGSESQDSGYVAPEPVTQIVDVEDPLALADADNHGSALENSEFQPADPSIEYPEVEFPEPGIDPEPDSVEGEMTVSDEPIPYIPEEFPEDPEDPKEPEVQEVSFTEAMGVISSFKNQAEVYYNYGQEELDKMVIKYSSKMKYICENYESKIIAGEGLDAEAFEKFKSDINLLISQINVHNGGSDAETYTVQEKSDNSDFEGKDEIRQYLYSK